MLDKHASLHQLKLLLLLLSITLFMSVSEAAYRQIFLESAFSSGLSNPRGVGDINNDGYDDIVMKYGSGLAIYYGAEAGIRWRASSALIPDKQTGFSASDYLAGAGDVNGDGYDDVIVTIGSQNNSARIYYGSPAGLSATGFTNLDSVAARISAVAGVGDINADGYDDVILGSWTFDDATTNQGKVYLFYGGDGADNKPNDIADWSAIGNPVHVGRFGSAVTGGDFNCDGNPDVAVGALGDGAAFVYYNTGTALPLTPSWEYQSTVNGGQMGTRMTNAGNVDGSGCDALMVGEPYGSSGGPYHEGLVYLFFGSASGLRADNNYDWLGEGNQASSLYSNPDGNGIAGLGDINGDGLDDIIVGARYFDNAELLSAGAAYIYHGSDIAGPSSIPDVIIKGNVQIASLGRSVSSAGDMDGDGKPDYMVSRLNEVDHPTSPDGIYLYLSRDPAPIYPHVTISPDQAHINELETSETGATTDTFTVVLDTQPTADVRIDVLSGDTTEGTVSPSIINFTPSNWDQPVTVTVTAVDDPWFDNTASYPINFKVASTDLNYNRMMVTPLRVLNRDDECNGCSTVSPVTALKTSEDGTTATFSVVLNTKPNLNVYIDVSSDDPTEGTTSTDQLIFTRENYNTPQIVTVTGVDDTDIDGDITYKITLARTSSADASWDNKVVSNVTVKNFDNDWSVDINGYDSGISNSQMGRSVAAANVNGDAYMDMIVGAPMIGKVYVFYGSASGINPLPDWELTTDQPGDWLGVSVARAGDVNGDGVDDIIIGASRRDVGIVDRAGAAYVFHGSSTSGLQATPSVATADWTFEGDLTNGYVGYSVAAAGNVNRTTPDVADDVIIGGYGYNGTGRAWVFHGVNGTGLSTSAAWSDVGPTNSRFGFSVSSAGDINGDGDDDIVIGARGNNTAHIYHGSSSGIAGVATTVKEALGSAVFDFGSAVAAAGDVDNDTFDDIIIGAPSDNAVYIYRGSSTGLNTTAAWAGNSDQADSNYGAAVAGLGDVNGDGYADIGIGAPFYNNTEGNSGMVYVCKGSAAPTMISDCLLARGNQANGIFGGSLAALDDVDGNGLSEFVAGSTGYDDGDASDGSNNEGAALVVFLGVGNPGIFVTPLNIATTEAVGPPATFDIKLMSKPDGNVTLNLTNNDPTEGTLSQDAVLFTTGNWFVPQTISVTGEDDGLLDGNISYAIDITATSPTDLDYEGMVGPSITVTNANDDGPIVTLAVSDDTANENFAHYTGIVTLSRSGPTSSPLTVYFDHSAGTAIAGSDYTDLGSSIDIPSGSASVDLIVVAVNDDLAEEDETVTVTLSPDAGYALGNLVTGSVTIIDNDNAGLSFNPTIGAVEERGTRSQFALTLSSQPADDVAVNFYSTNANEGVVMPSNMVFTPSNWNVPQTLTAVGLDDDTNDGNVTWYIHSDPLVSADPQYNGLQLSGVRMRTNDDDDKPKITILATADADETGPTAGRFTFARTGDLSTELLVRCFTFGTAIWNRNVYTTGNYDYELSPTNTAQWSCDVNIPAGFASASLMVTPWDDLLVEPGNETVTMRVSTNIFVYALGTPSQDTLIIADNDSIAFPVASFAPDQLVLEDAGSVTVTVTLDIIAASEVQIPYTVGGTAENPVDHDATSDMIIIPVGQQSGSATFNIVNDGPGEGEETVLFSMGTLVNATYGGSTTHTVTINDVNEAPTVNLVSAQAASTTRLVTTLDGNVTVTANTSDPNLLDTHSYDWGGTNVNLVDIDGNLLNSTFVFDPSALVEGFYKLQVMVTDNGSPNLSAANEILLEVVNAAPVLDLVDSDGDGVNDNVEGYGDTDEDGIPDYLDSSTLAANELQTQPGHANSYIMYSAPGLTLRLGDVAFASGSDAAAITANDIAIYGNGEGDVPTAKPYDTIPTIGGYYSFEVAGLANEGDAVPIVIPLLAAIPVNAVYRKFFSDTGWTDFVEDANNSIASMKGSPGLCPLPTDPAYVPGLNAGDYCLRLIIEDGGPNDTDGLVNRVVEDPGYLAALDTETSLKINNGGGGHLGLWMLLWLTLGYGMRHVAWQRNSKTNGRILR